MSKSSTIRYEFEELRPYPGFDVLVHGHADIQGEWQSAERDVGIMWGGWGYSVDAIYISGEKLDDAPWALEKDHPLYSLIESQLCSQSYSDHICDELGDPD